MPSRRWIVAWLLVILVIINFGDKAVLGLAAVPLMQELRISPAALGLVASSFFVPFALTSVVMGFVANTVLTRWILLALALSWAVVQAPMLAAASLPTLLFSRAALGAAEGPTAAVAVHAIHKWFRDDERALPTALVVSGASLGLVVAPPLLSLLIDRAGWRAAFAALIVVSVVWAIIWLAFGREGKLEVSVSESSVRGPRSVAFWRLVTTWSWLGATGMCFAAFWAGVLSLTWLPTFLEQGLGFDTLTTGGLVAVPAVVSTAAVIGSGWASQRLVRGGVSTRWARGFLAVGAVTVSGLSLAAVPAVQNPTAVVSLLAAGFGLVGAVFPLTFLVIAEVSPVAQRAGCLGACVAVYSTGGVLAPAVSGALMETAAVPYQGFDNAIRLCALLLVVSGIAGALAIRPQVDARSLGLTATGAGAAG